MSGTDDRQVPAYILRRPSCGHVVGVCVDDGGALVRREAAKFCGDGIRNGLAVERTTVGAVRDGSIGDWCLSTCPESPNNQKNLKGKLKRQLTLSGSGTG